MKRGDVQNLHLARVDSPLGPMLIVFDGAENLRALDWAEFEPRTLRLLRLHYGADGFALGESTAPDSLTAPLAAYFAGDLQALDAVPVRTGGTEFQRAVWAALRTIPVGATTTYSALADRLGRPQARRAVGMANGSNPVGIVVPCHRVIGAAGLTGYAGGLERKGWLLRHEGAILDDAA